MNRPPRHVRNNGATGAPVRPEYVSLAPVSVRSNSTTTIDGGEPISRAAGTVAGPCFPVAAHMMDRDHGGAGGMIRLPLRDGAECSPYVV